MKKLILSLLLLSVSAYALADEVVTLQSGEQAILHDNGRWSIITPQKEKTPETYEEIKLAALLQDIDAVQRNPIKITAFAEVYEFMLMLKQDKMDTSSLLVNINKLPHGERETLRAGCLNGCDVTVYGRVGDIIQGDKGIIADKVEWK